VCVRVRACVRACTSRNNSIFKELYCLFADAGCRYSELTAVAGASERCSAFLAAHSSASKSPTLLPLSTPGICYWLPVCQRVVFKIAGLVHSDWLPRTSQTTVAFCRTLVVAHCGPIPMTCGSCLCHEHTTNSVIGVSRPLVLDCGMTFHLDSGGRDLPSTLSDNL